MAAADALVIVDLGHEVLDLDGVRRALTLALHAADAADVADLARDGALVLIAAANEHGLLVRHTLDDLLRAGIGAGHAADALVAVDLGDAVDDVHRAELTGSGAVAEADAGEAALLIALAAKEHGGLAILRAGVVEALDGDALRTGARHERDHLLLRTGGDAHDLGDLIGSGLTAGHTAVDRSLAGRDRGGITVTAGVAAAAAVGAGETRTDSFLLGVDLHIEDLRGKGQQRAEDGAHGAEDSDALENQFKIHIHALLSRSSCRRSP